MLYIEEPYTELFITNLNVNSNQLSNQFMVTRDWNINFIRPNYDYTDYGLIDQLKGLKSNMYENRIGTLFYGVYITNYETTLNYDNIPFLSIDAHVDYYENLNSSEVGWLKAIHREKVIDEILEEVKKDDLSNRP